MTDHDRLDPLAAFASSDAGVELEAQVQEVFRAFGQAMMYGQLLEWASGLAAPAANGPVDDDEASQRAVNRGVKLKFVDAIKEFEAAAAASGQIDLPLDLVTRLHDARKARNVLAHSWVWDGGMRSFAGEAKAVVAELDDLCAAFMELLSELFEVVFTEAIAARGVDPEAFASAQAGLTAALIARPDLAEGLAFPFDTDVFVERVLAALAEEGLES